MPARDVQDFLKGFRDQAADGLKLGTEFCAHHNFRCYPRILFMAVGGSAMSGDILRVLVSDRSNFHLCVHREADLPRWVGDDTFVIFSSYSGNSKEVLRAFGQFRVREGNALVVTSGGELAALAAEKKVPCLKIPGGIPPRCALGYLAFSVLPVLERVGDFRVPQEEIREMLEILRTDVRPEARRIASKLKGRMIALYGVSGFMEPAVMRWRAQLAENAKTLSAHHFLPEMLHNEIEGWREPAGILRRSAVVFLTDPSDWSELEPKRRAAAAHMKKCGAKVLTLESRGERPLARLFSLILLGDWVSYELAAMNRVDPFGIPTIDRIKNIQLDPSKAKGYRG
ncbi:MAG: bifunctional phosphoglucose/phosphomannose isomerase [Candidatus Omnitrophota bacterium]